METIPEEPFPSTTSGVESYSSGRKEKAINLQKLIVKSRSARLLAIRQVTQLNSGKKTAGVDGKASLSFKKGLNSTNS